MRLLLRLPWVRIRPFRSVAKLHAVFEQPEHERQEHDGKNEFPQIHRLLSLARSFMSVAGLSDSSSGFAAGRFGLVVDPKWPMTKASICAAVWAPPSVTISPTTRSRASIRSTWAAYWAA